MQKKTIISTKTEESFIYLNNEARSTYLCYFKKEITNYHKLHNRYKITNTFSFFLF